MTEENEAEERLEGEAHRGARGWLPDQEEGGAAPV